MPHRNKAITKEQQDSLTPMKVIQDYIEGTARIIRDEVHAIDHKALISQTTDGKHQ